MSTEKMTHQHIFDQVVAHLRKQGIKSVHRNGSCLYRGPDGTKCAVGCLIRDDEYNSGMELNYVSELVEKRLSFEVPQSLKIRVLNNDNLPLLHALQAVHDRSFVHEWEIEFQFVAKSFGLTYTPRGK